MVGKNLNTYSQIIFVFLICIFINVLASFFNFQLDLTADKRFTLSENTEKIIANVDENVTIKVLLGNDLPAGFKRLQSATEDMLNNFRDINPNIVYTFEDPNDGTLQEKETKRKILQQENIVPISLSYSDGTELVQKAVYPFAIIYFGSKKYLVNLLEEQKPGDDEDIILNTSVAMLEYKFVDGFQKLQQPRPQNILFTQSNDEWDENHMFRLESELRRYHKVGRVGLDSIIKLDSTVDLVIISGPKTNFTLQNLFKLDQYIMQGGNIIWMIDKFQISLDSINHQKFYIPQETQTGIDEVLFKYGVRIQPDLVMDLECSPIPQVIGMAGDRPQTKLFPWPYHVSISPKIEHPIVKNIDRVNMFFPSTIDTVKTDGNISKTILLESSKYSRSQLAPVRLTFEILKVAPDPSKYNDGNKSLAVLLEGEFESFFKNRVTPEFQTTLDQLGIEFIANSRPSKQLVISDSDFAKNLINLATGESQDIGYNKWERKFYKGNKDFILNAVEYILGGDAVLQSRSKEIKLRLLDTVKSKQEKTKWQLINVVLPVVLLIFLGSIFHFFRKRKYTKSNT